VIPPESAHADHRNINCRLLALGFSAVGMTARGMLAQTNAPERRNNALLSQFAGPIERALPHFPDNFPKNNHRSCVHRCCHPQRREEKEEKKKEEKNLYIP
jgi:hypothetical protein